MPVDPPPTETRPAWRSPRAATCFGGLLLALLAADLLLKSWAFSGAIGPDQTIILTPRLLALKLTLNKGAVFGMMPGFRWTFVIATFVALVVVLYFFCRSSAKHRWLHAALALVLAGSLGNLYDRLVWAGVRDMLWLFPGVHLPFGWNWPGGATDLYPWIFNLADAYLLVGIGFIFLRSCGAPVVDPATEGGERP